MKVVCMCDHQAILHTNNNQNGERVLSDSMMEELCFSWDQKASSLHCSGCLLHIYT